jgi:hypothetical protein
MSAAKTPELLAEILSVIAADATGRFMYYRPTGEMCALGGLAHHAGIELPDPVPDDGGYDDNGTLIQELPRFSEALCNRYGFTLQELQFMQRINDGCPDLGQRREALREYVEKIWS